MTFRAAILTVSDRAVRGERADESGPALRQRLEELGWQVAPAAIAPDEQAVIAAWLAQTADSGAVDLILTTGGTGFAPRDVTPEATQAVIERAAPGLAEAMRAASLKITAHAMLSRATAGIRGHTLIINLPGSPRGALENLAVLIPVLPHALQLLRPDAAAQAEAEAGHRSI